MVSAICDRESFGVSKPFRRFDCDVVLLFMNSFTQAKLLKCDKINH